MGNWLDKAVIAKKYIEDIISNQLGNQVKHDVAIILGSGLGSLVDTMEECVFIPYGNIPGFPLSTVHGHAGRLVSGLIAGRRILAMQGRFHIYEGYESAEVTLPVRVFKLMGISNLIVTNAAGAINRSFHKGQFMLIKDHISLFLPSPLKGLNEEEFGLRFPPMDKAYDPDLLKLAKNIALDLNIDIVEGVYTYAQGPMFETPAEIKALSVLGSDAVGMSTVPETIIAVHCGIKVLGISCLTNMAAGISQNVLSHEEVNETGKMVESLFSSYINAIIKAI